MGTEIFVFGSNKQGRHGKGAALHAVKFYGAKYGQGEGLQGHSYAISTKITPYINNTLIDIHRQVSEFKKYAEDHPELTFNVTAVGCGLAGFKPVQIAPMFKDSPQNVNLPIEFIKVINANTNSLSSSNK